MNIPVIHRTSEGTFLRCYINGEKVFEVELQPSAIAQMIRELAKSL